MAEESKKDEKSEGSGKKPNEGSKDKTGDQPGAQSVKPTETKPGETGGQPPKPGPAGAAREPEKKSGPSSPSAAAGAKPGEAKRPPAAPPKKARKFGCLSAGLWLVAVLVVIAVGGYFSWPYWSRYAEPYLPKMMAAEDPRVATLESRVAEIERKLKAPRPEIEAIRALQEGRKEVDERLGNVLKQVESLQKAITSLGKMTELVKGAETGDAEKIVAALTPKIDKVRQDLARAEEQADRSAADLAKRIDEVEAKVQVANQGASDAASAALAVGQLAQALKGSGPFSEELNGVKAFAKDDPEMAAAIAALEPRAAEGVPTLSELRGRFPAVARAVVQADTKREEKGWVDRAVNRLSSLVTIRRTGERAVAAGGTDGALAGAERALAANDLAAAIQAMETLKPSAAEAAAGWLGDARARMAAERLLAILRTRAISHLSARG